MGVIHLKTNAKRILYKLKTFKRNYMKLHEFTNGRGAAGAKADLETLRRLMAKGLVARSDEDFEGYYLTEKGREAATPIVKEIDEYKRW